MTSANNTPYVAAVVIMVSLAIVGIILIEVLRDGDNTASIAALIGVLTPTTLSLLAFMKSQDTHLLVNSRMTEFKDTLEELSDSKSATARAEGVVEGIESNKKLTNK